MGDVTPRGTASLTEETVVRTNIRMITTIIGIAFAAGVWATWMSFKVEALTQLVAELQNEIHELHADTGTHARNP